jgi:hypothetical protein
MGNMMMMMMMMMMMSDWLAHKLCPPQAMQRCGRQCTEHLKPYLSRDTPTSLAAATTTTTVTTTAATTGSATALEAVPL